MDRDEQLALWAQMQDEVAAKMADRLEDIISNGMREAVTSWTLGSGVRLPMDFNQQVAEALNEGYADITVRMGASVVDQFKDGYPQLETKQDNEAFYRQVWEQFIATYGALRVVQISNATRDQINRIIEAGMRDGLGVDPIARQIRQRLPTFSALRSAVIARTETHSAGMYASTRVAQAAQIPLMKQWASVEDGRTRDFGEGGDGIVDAFNHRVMDEQTVPLEEPYLVPGKFGVEERLMYPGDPQGSAGNVINCRCSQTYVRAQ